MFKSLLEDANKQLHQQLENPPDDAPGPRPRRDEGHDDDGGDDGSGPAAAGTAAVGTVPAMVTAV